MNKTFLGVSIYAISLEEIMINLDIRQKRLKGRVQKYLVSQFIALNCRFFESNATFTLTNLLNFDRGARNLKKTFYFR